MSGVAGRVRRSSFPVVVEIPVSHIVVLGSGPNSPLLDRGWCTVPRRPRGKIKLTEMPFYGC